MTLNVKVTENLPYDHMSMTYLTVIAGLCCNGVTLTEVTEVTTHLGIYNLT